MSLTGLPLILLTGLLALAAGVVTVRGWRVGGRKRLPLRVAGLVAVEVLLVADVGLVVNRQEDFYPSWQALGGSETVAAAPTATAGRLDGELDTGRTIAWTPPEATAWHLVAAPVLVTAPEYGRRDDLQFPVVVALTTAAGLPEARRRAQSTSGLLTLIVQPTRATTAAALAAIPGLLGRDARVEDGLALLADPQWDALAATWPGRPPVFAGHTAAAFEAAARALPAPLAASRKLPS